MRTRCKEAFSPLSLRSHIIAAVMQAARAFREMPLRVALDADQRFGETVGIVIESRRRRIEEGEGIEPGAGEIGIPRRHAGRTG